MTHLFCRNKKFPSKADLSGWSPEKIYLDQEVSSENCSGGVQGNSPSWWVSDRYLRQGDGGTKTARFGSRICFLR